MVGIDEPSLGEKTLYRDATKSDDLRPDQVFVHIPDDIHEAQLFFFDCMERNLRCALGMPDRYQLLSPP